MFGPQVAVSIGKFSPFAHALLGAAHVSDSGDDISTSGTSLAYAIGGGLDYKLTKGIAWRFQGDALHTRFFGSTQDHLRFSTGVVFRFGPLIIWAATVTKVAIPSVLSFQTVSADH